MTEPDIKTLKDGILRTLGDDYFKASTHSKPRVKPADLTKLVKMVDETTDADDLLVYRDFPLIQNFVVDRSVADLRRALGVQKLHGVVTQRHFDVWDQARTVFESSPRKFGYNPTDNLVWSLLITFIIRDHLDQAETVIGYMRERGIFSTDDLKVLMAAGGANAALADGAL